MMLRKWFLLSACVAVLGACSTSSPSDTTAINTSPESPANETTTTVLEAEEFPPWDEVPGPPVPTVTDPVPIGSVTTATGVYWAEAMPLIGDPNNTVVFVLSRFYSGEECIQYAISIGIDPESGDACPNGYAVQTEPRAVMAIADDATVTVSYVETQQSTLITTAILKRLVRNEEPIGTPSDFDYTPFPFVVSTIDGVIVSAQQVWVP
jgi:hypothetical protein